MIISIRNVELNWVSTRAVIQGFRVHCRTTKEKQTMKCSGHGGVEFP